MARTILVPTDFSIGSLNMVKTALAENLNEPLHVVFAIGYSLSGSITDMLFYSKEDILRNIQTTYFKQACQIILNRYEASIASMRVELFTGYTQAAFSNFLEGNRIDAIYIPENNSLQFEEGKTFDPTPYILKSALPKHTVHWKERTNIPANNKLAELFLNWAVN